MIIKNTLFLYISTVLLINMANGEQLCNKRFLDDLESNDKLTHAQKFDKAKRYCVGKYIEIDGVIEDVGRLYDIDMVGKDGLKYTIDLSPDHDCGDLLELNKGQEISISGIIKAAVPHWPKISIELANCIKK